MGIRETQYYGLPLDAKAFLAKNAALRDIDPCPHCHKTTKQVQDTWVHGGTTGMFDEDVPFHAYRLKDGSVAIEAEQVQWWSSGPMIFTKLTKVNGDVIAQWSVAELAEHGLL